MSRHRREEKIMIVGLVEVGGWLRIDGEKTNRRPPATVFRAGNGIDAVAYFGIVRTLRGPEAELLSIPYRRSSG
jgi:hypothetical protein